MHFSFLFPGCDRASNHFSQSRFITKRVQKYITLISYSSSPPPPSQPKPFFLICLLFRAGDLRYGGGVYGDSALQSESLKIQMTD